MELSVWFHVTVPVGPAKPLQRSISLRVDHYFTSEKLERFRVHGKYRMLWIDYNRGKDQPWRLTNAEKEPQAVMDYVSLIIPQIITYLSKWKGSGQVTGFLNIDAPKDWGSWPGYANG